MDSQNSKNAISKQTKGKISLLVTYYTQVQYVDDSMRSLLAIDKPDEWEILVGDDGSTDGTVEKVKEYVAKDPEHIKLIVANPDEKKKTIPRYYSAMNRLRLLEQASGEYFCVMDGDDWYTDTSFVKEAMHVFEQEQDVSMVMFGYTCFKSDTYYNLTVCPKAGKLDSAEYLGKCWYVHAGAVVYRNCFDQDRIRLLKERGLFIDNSIVFNSLDYGCIYSIPRSIYSYRVLENSIWHSLSRIVTAAECSLSLDSCRAILPSNLHLALDKRSYHDVLYMYLHRDQISTIPDKKKDEIEKMWTPYLPSIRYDLFHYKDLSSAQFRKVKRQILRGHRLELCKIWANTELRGKVTARLKKLPYIRDLVFENELLKKQVAKLQGEIKDLEAKEK